MTPVLRPPTGRTAAAAVALVAALASILDGIAATSSAAPKMFAAIVGIVAVGALISRFGAGVLIGILSLGTVDVLPGPNLEELHVAFTITGQDVFVGALVVTLLGVGRSRLRELMRASNLMRALVGWSGVFIVVWLFEILRTAATTPVPLIHAVWFGRDFAYFALLLPLFVAALAEAHLRKVVLITVGVGAFVTGLAQVAAAVGVSDSLLVHSTQFTEIDGLVRVYTGGAYLPIAALPVSLGIAILTADRLIRWTAIVVFIVSVAAVGVGLTRAVYAGEILGIAVAIAVWLPGRTHAARSIRRSLGVTALVMLVATVALVAYHPPSEITKPVSAVYDRFLEGTGALNGNSLDAETLNIRTTERSELAYALGGHWLFGLGFLDPSYVYDGLVPSGSIRNPDVGYFNTLMTMGVFGTVLYYVAPILILCGLGLRRFRMEDYAGSPEELGIIVGVTAYLIAVLVSSQDLVILFSPVGVASAAFTMGLGGALLMPSRDTNHP